MARKTIAKDGEKTRFSSTNQPENKGRKPSILKQYIKKYNVSKDDINAMIECILFDHTFGQIEDIKDDKDKMRELPLFMYYLINTLNKAAGKGDIKWLDSILDRKSGKQSGIAEIHIISDEAKERLEMIFQEKTEQDNSEHR